jgi:hypothetical protein
VDAPSNEKKSHSPARETVCDWDGREGVVIGFPSQMISDQKTLRASRQVDHPSTVQPMASRTPTVEPPQRFLSSLSPARRKAPSRDGVNLIMSKAKKPSSGRSHALVSQWAGPERNPRRPPPSPTTAFLNHGRQSRSRPGSTSAARSLSTCPDGASSVPDSLRLTGPAVITRKGGEGS